MTNEEYFSNFSWDSLIQAYENYVDYYPVIKKEVFSRLDRKTPIHVIISLDKFL